MTKTVQNSFVEFRCIATSEYPREEICVRYRDWPFSRKYATH
jgi:hypothetical protein